MMGTGPFAVPTFERLYTTRHTVAALVTSPVRIHRGRPVAPVSSIREVAQAHGTPILDPEDANTPEAQADLARFEADLLVVCDYGQILAPATLATARLGGVNLHGSLLPKYRGAAPIQWAIYHGDVETGVTVTRITPKLDAGPCIAQARVSIGPDETAAELEPRLAELGAGVTCDAIDRLESGQFEETPQDPARASRAPKLRKTDGLVDWSRPAAAIKNHIRAMTPWPGAYTFWHRPDGPPLRLILGPVSVVSSGAETAGTVLEAAGDRLIIAAGQDALMPSTLQPAGKRPMSLAEFLRGHRLRPGDRFGPDNHFGNDP